MIKRLIEFILWAGKARWIVDDDGDVGFTLFNHTIVNYKWNDTFIVRHKKRGEDPYTWRLAEKRELQLNQCNRLKVLDIVNHL